LGEPLPSYNKTGQVKPCPYGVFLYFSFHVWADRDLPATFTLSRVGLSACISCGDIASIAHAVLDIFFLLPNDVVFKKLNIYCSFKFFPITETLSCLH